MVRRSFFFLFGLSLLACSTAASKGDGSEASESDYTVTPTGGTGQLRATAPSGAIGRIVARRKDGGSVLELTSGTLTAVAPGAYCIHTRITGSSAYDVQFETHEDCSIEVNAGATVDYALGAVKFERSRDELLVGLDVGRDQSYASQAVRRMLTTTQPIAHAKGAWDYAYVSIKDGYSSNAQYEPLDSISFDVSPGATTEVDVLDTTGKWAVRLVPATGRTLPNATGASTTISARVQWSEYSVVDGWFEIGALTKPVLVRAKAQSNVYVSSPAPQTVALTQPVSEKKLARLDVEHVQITMPDGSIAEAHGTVKVGSGLLTFPTGAGVDLLPGTYELTVTYAHPADHSPITTNITADVQP